MSRKSLVPQPFPLSKVMHPAEDFPQLVQELTVVEQRTAGEGQNEYRVWEYAMGLKAIRAWMTARPMTPLQSDVLPLDLCDVGGAGSGFARALATLTSYPIDILDEGLHGGTPPAGQRYIAARVEDYVSHFPYACYDVLTCISVIEHVVDLPTFLRACQTLLRPGGLFFLTTDCWNCDGPDTAQFHWMRQRIYNPESIGKLQASLRDIGFRSFGRSDWAYHGNFVRDYSFCSIAMVKEWPNGRRRLLR